jgi:hypothetical protein
MFLIDSALIFVPFSPPLNETHTVKKVGHFLVSNSPWRGIIELFPARESLVIDIPAEDGKIANLFFTVQYLPEDIL